MIDMKYKKINIIKLLIIMTLLLVSMVGCGKNTARTIKVEELEGTADVTNNEGTLDAYVGQNLQSGDEVGVMDESSLLLLLDTDKHVFATEGADFVIVADGVNRQTKTIIEQSSGTMIYGIDNKLGSEETFHVRTPNATMAVRGTVFTVEVSGGATPVTELSVKEGCIEVSTVENGETVTKDVNAGEVVTFTGNNPEFSGELQTDDSKSDTVIAQDTSSESDVNNDEQMPGTIRISGTVADTTSDYKARIDEIIPHIDGTIYSSTYFILDEFVELEDGLAITNLPLWGISGDDGYLGKHVTVDCVIEKVDYSDEMDYTDDLFGTEYAVVVYNIVSEY